MSYSSWPGEADVLAVLGTYGVSEVPSGFEADDEVAAVVAGFERSVGFGPVLAAGSSEVIVELGGHAGAVVSLPVPMVSVTAVELNEVELSEGEGYWLVGRSPWRLVRLASIGSVGRLSVTGQIGLFEEVPGDLWAAVRDLVVVKVLSAAGFGSESVAKIRQDSVSVEYGSGSASSVIESLRSEAEAVLRSWVLIGVGGV